MPLGAEEALIGAERGGRGGDGLLDVSACWRTCRHRPPRKGRCFETQGLLRNTFRKNQKLKNKELETPSPRINNSRTENNSGYNHTLCRRRVL